jgi:RHS repeat-associated protein
VTEITQPTGAVVEWVTYDVYGQPTIRDINGTVISQSAVGNPYLYTGREYDAESGLYFYRARTYDPGTGRFLQRDPAGCADGPSAYQFVQSSPTCATDPSGLSAVPEPDKSKAPGSEANPREAPRDRHAEPWVDDDLEKVAAEDENEGWTGGAAHPRFRKLTTCQGFVIFAYSGPGRYAFAQYVWIKIEWETLDGKTGSASSTEFVPDTPGGENTFYPTQSHTGSPGTIVMHDRPGYTVDREALEGSRQRREDAARSQVEQPGDRTPNVDLIHGDPTNVQAFKDAVAKNNIKWFKVTASYRTWVIDLSDGSVVHEWKWGYWYKINVETGEVTDGWTNGETR